MTNKQTAVSRLPSHDRRRQIDPCRTHPANGKSRRPARHGSGEGSYATKAANVVRSEDERKAANERRRLEAAKHIVDVLGQMKGAAMKVGQVASFIDLQGLPTDELDSFQAVRADLQNLGLLLRAAKRIAPGLDSRATLSEVRDRITEELDYEHEAQAHRAFARRWRGHPFIVIPNVVNEMRRERVLVTEFFGAAPGADGPGGMKTGAGERRGDRPGTVCGRWSRAGCCSSRSRGSRARRRRIAFGLNYYHA